MTRSIPCLPMLALLWALHAVPAHADSSASSAASGSSAASVGSLSNSIQGSSNSSSRGTEVAEGDYRIIDVAAAADRPGSVRMTLHPLSEAREGGEFVLTVPRETVELARLAQGHVVAVLRRPYGLAFRVAGADQAFYLALADDWYRELQTRAVRL